eukprot:9342057-Lingulodinium_polyedra.AAC.1
MALTYSKWTDQKIAQSLQEPLDENRGPTRVLAVVPRWPPPWEERALRGHLAAHGPARGSPRA